MRIALYQCSSRPLDVAGNLDLLEQRAAEAAEQGVDVLVCPEMYLSGYNIGADAARRLAEAHDGASARRVARIARAHGLAILYGYPERDGEAVYNAVQLFDEHGASLCNYRKTHLYGTLDRAMFARGGDHFPPVDYKGWRLGFLICYDVEFPENTRRLALAGVEAILVPTANMLPYDFIPEVTVRSRAFENQCYVAYANFSGREGDVEYCGLSSISAPDGSQPARAGRDEALIVADLDRRLLEDTRATLTYFQDRRPELYRPQ